MNEDMDKTTAIQSRVIGLRLVELSLLTDEQLEQALTVQEETGGALGQILLEQFGVTQLDFTSVLTEQGLEHPEVASQAVDGPTWLVEPGVPTDAPAPSANRRPIGEVFVELGLITDEQLAAALDVQRTSGERLGEILVEQQYVTRLDLAGALARHWEPREPPADAGDDAASDGAPSSLGAGEGWSPEDHAAVAELELELRAAEERLLAPQPPARRRGLLRRRRAKDVSEVSVRVDELAAGFRGMGSVGCVVTDLSRSVAQFDAARAGEALAAGARFAAVESAVAGLVELEVRLQDEAGRALAETAESLAAGTADLRVELEAVAARPEVADPSERLVELAERIDRAALDGHDRITGLVGDFSQQLADVVSRFDGLVGRDEAVAASRADRAGLERHVSELETRLHAQGDEMAGTRARVEESLQTTAGITARQDETESLIAQQFAGVESRDAAGLARARADSEAALASLHGATVSLEVRVNEELALRQSEIQATLAGSEELGVQIEAVAASFGARLVRLEESGPEGDATELLAKVGELEGRIEAQAAIGEEQARVTERALRKGLASLGQKLTRSAAKHDKPAKHGKRAKGAGRSIELLGAALFEADARIGGRVPLSPLEGYVAFAPTADGYRLLELADAPPELGATIELDACDVPLLVTRYGRSPLPFDGRPCAYLDRA